MSLVLDLRVANDRVGSSTDPALNGHLRSPNNLDQSLNDVAADKIYVVCGSGRLHSEFIRILFLQAHRETDRFFTTSGVLSA